MFDWQSYLTPIVVGLVLFVGLTLPDLLFLGRGLLTSHRKKLVHHVAQLLFLCLLIGVAGGSVLAAIIVIVLFVLSAIWHLSYAYFGDVLRPEAVVLFFKPDHFADVVEVGFKEGRRLIPVLALIACCAAVSLALLLNTPAPQGSNLIALLGVAWLLALGIRVTLRRKEAGVFPTAAMPGAIGSLHAVALAAKWTWLRRSVDEPPFQGSVEYSFRDVGESPVTVAVIMGESITPGRMSLFGGPENTTPLLSRRAVADGRFRLFARTGFSAGVASNSSISGFLTGSPFPTRTQGSRTLFELAKQQGFTNFYLSAQKRSPLDMTGSLGALDLIETNETNAATFPTRRDWILVDLLQKTPLPERSFLFLYQRVNHAPYYNHQIGTPEPFHAYPRGRDEILHNYHVGLRTYDRNTDAILAELEKRPGAVFVIITADHGEHLGEDGHFGHNLSGSLHCASVPVLLFTNLPEHPAVREFLSEERLDAFSVARIVMRALGVEVGVSGLADDTFYVNNALPFGRSGYISVTPGDAADEYRVVLNDRDGNPLEHRRARIGPFASPRTPEEAEPDARVGGLAL